MARAGVYEREVATYINEITPIKASRPKVSTHYSDVLLEHGDKHTWLEVKMNTTDQLGSIRVEYDGKRWNFQANKSPLKLYCVDYLNNSKDAENFIQEIKDYFKRKHISLPTSSVTRLREWETALSISELKDFFNQRENKYIIHKKDVPLGKIVRDHYVHGKYEPAHYMQAGDNFYRLSNEDPLNVGKNVPLLDGNGLFVIRMSIRSKFYETLPTIKISNLLESNYSLKPGSNKKNPFTI